MWGRIILEHIISSLRSELNKEELISQASSEILNDKWKEKYWCNRNLFRENLDYVTDELLKKEFWSLNEVFRRYIQLEAESPEYWEKWEKDFKENNIKRKLFSKELAKHCEYFLDLCNSASKRLITNQEVKKYFIKTLLEDISKHYIIELAKQLDNNTTTIYDYIDRLEKFRIEENSIVAKWLWVMYLDKIGIVNINLEKIKSTNADDKDNLEMIYINAWLIFVKNYYGNYQKNEQLWNVFKKDFNNWVSHSEYRFEINSEKEYWEEQWLFLKNNIATAINESEFSSGYNQEEFWKEWIKEIEEFHEIRIKDLLKEQDEEKRKFFEQRQMIVRRED